MKKTYSPPSMTVGNEHGKSTNYIVKKDIPTGDYGFNALPPGQELDNQSPKPTNAMPMRSIVDADGYRAVK